MPRKKQETNEKTNEVITTKRKPAKIEGKSVAKKTSVKKDVATKTDTKPSIVIINCINSLVELETCNIASWLSSELNI